MGVTQKSRLSLVETLNNVNQISLKMSQNKLIKNLTSFSFTFHFCLKELNLEKIA